MKQYAKRITRLVPWALVALLVAVSGFQLASAKSKAGYIHKTMPKAPGTINKVSARPGLNQIRK